MLATNDLTRGERLRIWRRRHQLTQVEAAKTLGMPLGSYKRAEADDPAECWDIPEQPLGLLQPHEQCMVLRRRSGLTLDELSDKVGLSKWWLCLIEQGKAPTRTLLEYWSNAAS